MQKPVPQFSPGFLEQPGLMPAQFGTTPAFPAQAGPGPTQAGPTAAPVQPVSYPTYIPPTGIPTGIPTQQQMTPQQAWTQRMVSIARLLEQGIPGWQLVASAVDEITSAPGASAMPGRDALVGSIKDAVFHRDAALGTIRRFVCGEASPALLAALAYSVNRLARVQSQIRPLFERWVMNTAIEQRTPLSNLAQQLITADYLLGQAVTAVQSTVGPQIWETARTQAFGSTAPNTEGL